MNPSVRLVDPLKLESGSSDDALPVTVFEEVLLRWRVVTLVRLGVDLLSVILLVVALLVLALLVISAVVLRSSWRT